METKERIKCKYPMSLFYNYKDEVTPNTRVSTFDDCKRCEEMDCCIAHCLIKGKK